MAKGLRLTLDDKDLRRRLARCEDIVKKEASSKGLRAGSNYLIGQIKINITQRPLVDTGNLLNSVQEDELHLGEKAWITFGPHTVYARIHEYGGVIRPTNGKFLVFKGKDGNMVFTKSVTIPARPYIRPALDEHGDEALDLMGDTIGKVIDGAYG